MGVRVGVVCVQVCMHVCASVSYEREREREKERPPDPMHHAKIFKGQPRQFALCELVPNWCAKYFHPIIMIWQK